MIRQVNEKSVSEIVSSTTVPTARKYLKTSKVSVNLGINSSYKILETVLPTDIDCLNLCDTTADCVAARFDNDETKCWLFNEQLKEGTNKFEKAE